MWSWDDRCWLSGRLRRIPRDSIEVCPRDHMGAPITAITALVVTDSPAVSPTGARANNPTYSPVSNSPTETPSSSPTTSPSEVPTITRNYPNNLAEAITPCPAKACSFAGNNLNGNCRCLSCDNCVGGNGNADCWSFGHPYALYYQLPRKQQPWS